MKPLIIILLPLLMIGELSCSKASGSERMESNANFIPVDQANQMINSYLQSVGYPGKDDEVRSWLLDAASLRAYLADTSIVKVQVFLAHTLDWINTGKGGIKPQPGEFPNTVIVVGVNGRNQYQPLKGKVMDNAAPCPQLCDFMLQSSID